VRAVARLVTEMDELWLRLADAGHDLSVTFGQVTTDPDEAAFSKVAGRVSFSVDIRSASADTLALLRAEFDRLVSVIAEREEVQFELGPLTDSAPALMSPAVIADLAVAADKLGIPAATMPCGAGHDAAIFAQNGVPTGMVFLRNANGSHNPEESLEIGDFAAGARIVSRFCLSLPDRPA
jgi:N-carbamoyl-L-amino-acid hydrolase